MKTQYEEIQINLVMLTAQDVITASGFEGEEDSFPSPSDPNFGQ